ARYGSVEDSVGGTNDSRSPRLSMSSADWADCHLTASRPPAKRKCRTRDPWGHAAAMQTVPTRLVGVPPSGPAIPVTARPHGDPLIRQMPAAMASATGALTAP